MLEQERITAQLADEETHAEQSFEQHHLEG
jgi:hypothetical protein